MTEAEFLSDLRRREQEKIRMRVCVIADDVTARYGFFHECRAFSDEATDKEEGGLRIVAVEQIQELGRDRGIRPVVKGDGQLARRIGAANRRAEKLRAGIHRTVGGDSRSGSNDRRGRFDEPGIHAAIVARKKRPRATSEGTLQSAPGKRLN